MRGAPMRWPTSLLSSALMLLLTEPASATAMFVPLGDLPGGSFGSFAAAVSADGSTVVGSSATGIGGIASLEAFRWTSAAGMQGLGDLAGENRGAATAVSADGSVVVGWGDVGGGFPEAFRWTLAGGMVGLGAAPGDVFSEARDVSDDGSIVTGYTSPGPAGSYEAMRWSEATGMVGLGTLQGGIGWSEANGISADGSTIVGWSTANLGDPEGATLWSSGGMLALGCGYGSAASADGSVVVGGCDTAFRWTSADGLIFLGDLPGGSVSSGALDVSADGSIVVGESSASTIGTGREAFLWDAAHGMRKLDQVATGYGLDLTGWTLLSANGVSADGLTIVGSGINPDGNREGWLLYLPEPSHAALLGPLALAALARRTRQTR